MTFTLKSSKNDPVKTYVSEDGFYKIVKKPGKSSRRHRLTLQEEPVPPPVDVPDSVEKITDLRIVRAVTEEDRKKWRRLFHDEHYLRETTPSGRLIQYFVTSEKHGILGAWPFHPPRRGSVREMPGWTGPATSGRSSSTRSRT